MKLTLNTGDSADYGELILPNDLLWTDEFSWVPAMQVRTYSLDGTLIIQTCKKKAGRPITLNSTLKDMAWITRATAMQLLAWGNLENRVFTLDFQYPNDTRTFKVMFDQEGGAPFTGSPAKEFPGHSADDWFIFTIKLVEVV